MEFYSNYFETGDSLPSKKEQDEFYGAIVRYLFKGEEPEFKSPYIGAVFQGIRPSLEKQHTGRRNRIANGKQSESKPEANQKQTGSKSKANQKQTESKTENSADKLIREEANKLSSIDSPIVPFSEIISYLNEKTGKGFKASSAANQKHIRARFNEGYTVDDFKVVIDNMTDKWLNDPKMEQYLRPETLFGSKFDAYLNSKRKGGNVADFGEYANVL